MTAAALPAPLDPAGERHPALIERSLAEHEAFARGVGLRARGRASTPFATPREPPWLRSVRVGAHGTRATAAPVDADQTPYRLFYSAGLQSDLSDLPLDVTAIGVDLPLTRGALRRDGDRIVGVEPGSGPLAELAAALHDRPANLFLDNGAFRRRRGKPLTAGDLHDYLDRAEALVAELEHGGCCTVLTVAPDVIGSPEGTMALRNDRSVMSRYWHLASRGAYIMYPMHTGDDELIEAQLDQLETHVLALEDAWAPYAPQGRVVIGIPSNAAAVEPATVARIAWRAAQIGSEWAETPINWFHLLGTSRSRRQRGTFTVGDLAKPITDAYRWLSEADEFVIPTEPLITSDSTRGITTATKLAGKRQRPEVIAEQTIKGLHGGMRSTSPPPQLTLFNPGDPRLPALLAAGYQPPHGGRADRQAFDAAHGGNDQNPMRDIEKFLAVQPPASAADIVERLGYIVRWLKDESGPWGANTYWYDRPYPQLEVAKLLTLPGQKGEHRHFGVADSPEQGRFSRAYLDDLAASMRTEGFLPDRAIQVFTWADGHATIYEGNHRLRAAERADLPTIPVDWRYVAGAERLPTAVHAADYAPDVQANPAIEVRTVAGGRKALGHPDVVASHQRSLRQRRTHPVAVLIPCAGTKPFRTSPSHAHGYLPALDGLDVDVHVVSEPLGVVAYADTDAGIATDYDYPPELLRGEARTLLIERIREWLARVGVGYERIVVALPGHHRRLVEEAAASVGGLDLIDGSITACHGATCPDDHNRATSRAYVRWLRALVQRTVRARRNPEIDAARAAFMAEYEALTQPNPIGFPGERYWLMEQVEGEWCLVLTTVKPWQGAIYLADIATQPDELCEGRGFGSRVMRTFGELADKHGVRLLGRAEPFAGKRLSYDDLMAWYGRIGFVPLELGGYIERQPRALNPAGGGTAISRRVPAPARAIAAAEDVAQAIDLGAGRTRWGPTPWDPHHAPDDAALRRRYVAATSIYVLNVMPTRAEWDDHLALARRVLRPGGRFYATVRTDNACDGDWRKRTGRGWQVCRDPEAWAELLGGVFGNVREFDRGSGYVTYVGTRPV